MSNTSNYTADNIQILEGLEAVRKRPGMYIGSTSSRGLHHLVYEIVDNSVDEHLAGYCSEISVTLNADGTATIKDNGRGVKQEELDLLFKRFYRADSSRNSEQGGSGIGLAVVKKIIEDHGGRVWATGVEGQGLTMNFTLKKMTKNTL